MTRPFPAARRSGSPAVTVGKVRGASEEVDCQGAARDWTRGETPQQRQVPKPSCVPCRGEPRANLGADGCWALTR